MSSFINSRRFLARVIHHEYHQNPSNELERSGNSSIIRSPTAKVPQSLPDAAGSCWHRFPWRQLFSRLRVKPLPRRSHVITPQQPARAGISSVPASWAVHFDVGRNNRRKSIAAHPMFYRLANTAQGEPPMADADLFLDPTTRRRKLSTCHVAKLHDARGTPCAGLT